MHDCETIALVDDWQAGPRGKGRTVEVESKLDDSGLDCVLLTLLLRDFCDSDYGKGVIFV